MAFDTPLAPRRPHVWNRPTGNVEDSYAWMAQKSDPEIIHYLNKENEYAHTWYEAHSEAIQNIFEQIRSRIKEDDNSYPVLHRSWWYTSRTETGKEYAIHSRGPTAESATSQILLDENLEAHECDYFSLNAFEVSTNNQLLAWSADTDGSEKYTLRIRDLNTGTELADVIENTTWGGVAWSANDQFLFYVTPDEAMRPHKVWRHKVGTTQNEDVLVFEDADERFFVGVASSRSGEWIFIDSASKTSSETWIINAHAPTAPPTVIRARVDNVEYQVDHWGDVFAIVTNENAEDFTVCTAPVNTPHQWTPLVPHAPGARISQFECFQSFAVMQRWEQGQQTLSVVSRAGKISPLHILDEPHEVEIDANPNYDTDGIRIAYQSLTTPATTAWCDISSSQLSVLKQQEVPHCDLTQYTSTRVWATADDGTRVPADIVHHVKTPLNGTAPGLIYAYGSYEISIAPWFSVGRLSLLDAGWVWVLAHPRGGGEMGRSWYNNGKLLNKRNTFTDTLAVAHFVGDEKICDGSRLVVRGGSAGGLLVGACITLEPTCFAGAIAEVPFVDVVTTMSDPSLPLTVTEWEEWGDPREEPSASYILSYSPYDNTTSVKYPALYVTAGLNDPRVSYHEPAKWVAKIRYESPDTHVLFKCEMGAGHGGPTGRYEQWRDEAKTLVFAMECVR